VKLRVLSAVLAAALLCPSRARAGLETGTLHVRLAVAAVARLRALDFAWSAEVHERDGAAMFLSVPPGRHELTVERGGATTARTLLVQPGTTVVVTATIEPAASSIVETAIDQPAEGTAFSEAWLRDLPTSRDPWSLLETMEPVAVADRMDTGGVWTGLPGRVTAHGTSLTQAAFRFAGAEAIDPLGTGTSLLDPDLAWLSSLRFATSLLPASVAGAGPVLEAIPRRPGDAWSLGLTGDIARPDKIGDTTAAPPIARLDHWQSGSVTAGGPLTDRLSLLLAASARGAGRFEREEALELGSRIRSGMGQLVFTPSTGQEARLLAVGQAVERPYAGRAAALDAGSREVAGFALVQGEWLGRRREGTTATVKVTHTRGTLDSTEVLLNGTTERLRDGPVPEIPLPGDHLRTRTSVEAQLEWPGRLLGPHSTVQFGASAGREGATTTLVPGVWRTPERLNRVGARVWEHTVGPTQAHWKATDAAAWVEARSDPARRLSVQAGGRLEWLGASAAGGAEDVSWLTLSPRLRARWRLGQKLAVVAGLGQYRHRLPLSNLGFGDSFSPTANVYRWNDRNADGVFLLPERGALVARVGPGAPLASLDPGLRAPLTREVLLGIERRSGPWAARFVGLYRRETRLLETVNVGVTASDYTMLTVADAGGDILGSADDQLLPVFERRASSFGADRYVLTNVTGDDAWHEGAEITIAREGERFGLLLGATAHRSDGPNGWRGFRASENDQGVVGERLDQPNADTFARGRLFSDRAYTIKVASRYAAPGDIRLGMVARYQDGQPFARLVIVPGLAQGTEFVPAVPNGRHRFEFAITVDARIEKGFHLGRARLAAVAEAFNLLANAHEVEEDVVTGPAFRTPIASQPPRVFRVGVRMDLR
jgi:hypothetical protein